MTRAIRRQEGYALASVLMVAMILIAMTGLIMSRTETVTGRVSGDRTSEGALQAADSGIDYASVVLAEDPDFDTGQIATQIDTRDEIIAAAIARPAAAVVPTPEGEFVLLKPEDEDVVYAVGFSPTRADAIRVRVIRAEVGTARWTIDAEMEYALLVGGDLKIEAKKNDKDVEILGDKDWGHANGHVIFKKDKDENNFDAGCLTGYADQYSNEQPGTHVDCPAEGSVPFADIPVIDPMQVHYLSQYDVCPDGTIRHGPASPASGVTKALPGQPCTGSLVYDDLDLKNSDKGNKKVEFDKRTAEGVYFLWGRSAKVKIEKDETRHFTIIAAKPNDDLLCRDEQGGNKVHKEEYGDIELEVKDEAELFPHPEGHGYTIVTAGDIKFKVKGKDKKDKKDNDNDKRGTAWGLYLAHEQIRLESNDGDNNDEEEEEADDGSLPKGAVRGMIVAEDACDTHDSKVKNKPSEIKKGDIVWDDTYAIGPTDFYVSTGIEATLVPRSRTEI